MKRFHFPHDLALAKKQLHIWKLKISSFYGEFHHFRSMLTLDELRMMDGFSNGENKMRFGITRAFLRVLLAHYTHRHPRAIAFEKGEFGKPFLKNNESSKSTDSLMFNLSHSGDLAMIACCFDGDVGIDIERLTQHSDLAESLDNYFSPSEANNLAKESLPERNHLVLRIWTVKEAIAKALGLGLSMDFAGISVAFCKKQRLSVRARDNDISDFLKRVNITSFMADAEYYGAIVRSNVPWDIKQFSLSHPTRCELFS